MPAIQFEKNRFSEFRRKENEDVNNARVAIKGITGFIGFTSFAGLMTAGLYSGLKIGGTAAAVIGMSGGTFAAIIGGLIAAGVFCALLAFVYFKASKWLYKLFRRVTKGNETYRYLKAEAIQESKFEIDTMIESVAQLHQLHVNGIELINQAPITQGLTVVQKKIFELIKHYFMTSETTEQAQDRILHSKSLHYLRKDRAAEMLTHTRALKAFATAQAKANPRHNPRNLDDGLNAGRSPVHMAIFHKIRGWFNRAKSLFGIGARIVNVPMRPEHLFEQAPHHLLQSPECLVYSMMKLNKQTRESFSSKLLSLEQNYKTQTAQNIYKEIQRQDAIEATAEAPQTKLHAQREMDYLVNDVYINLQGWQHEPKAYLIEKPDQPVADAVDLAVDGAVAPLANPPAPDAGDADAEQNGPFERAFIAPADMGPAELLQYHSFLKSQVDDRGLSTALRRNKEYELKRVSTMLDLTNPPAPAAIPGII